MSPTGRFVSFRFVSFARAFVRVVWLPSAIRTEKGGRTFSIFPFEPPSFSFFLVCEVYKVYKVYKVDKALLPTPPKPPIHLWLGLSVWVLQSHCCREIAGVLEAPKAARACELPKLRPGTSQRSPRVLPETSQRNPRAPPRMLPDDSIDVR